MKKSRILAGIWMLFLVLAYLVSASITIGIAAVAYSPVPHLYYQQKLMYQMRFQW